MLVIAFFIQNITATLVIAAIFYFKSSSRAQAITSVVSAWVLMLGIAATGFWYYPSSLGKWAYLILLAVASLRHLRNMQIDQISPLRASRFLPKLASISAGTILLWQMAIGYLPVDGDFVDISTPFQGDSQYCVMSGGSSLVHNFHYLLGNTPASRYEMHAIDFTVTSVLGLRTKNFSLLDPQPREPNRYLIFDSKVIAPCSGDVVGSRSDQPDHKAGDKFRDRSGSNYVELSCDGVLITLAHLREGSVGVRVGQSVSSGDFLGRVGNSGNSEEPHLHIHANSVANEYGFSDPIPIRFNGRYLSRNECL